MVLNRNKDLKLYYSIGEVAEMFGVSETLLRYWETEFPQISPRKSGRNIRQYSKGDIEQIRVIFHLVKERGLKIAAARDVLKNNKTGADRMAEVIDRLTAVRSELEAMRLALEL